MIEITNLAAYLLAFCRLTIGLVFIYAFVGKVRNVRAFEQAIADFHILPSRLSSFAARIFLVTEPVTVIVLIVGGEILFWGFALASTLLFVFSIALISVLLRKIATSCTCFGTDQKQVSIYDVWRNVVFLACAILPMLVLWNTPHETASIPLFDLVLLFPIATIFMIMFTNLGDLVQVFR